MKTWKELSSEEAASWASHISITMLRTQLNPRERAIATVAAAAKVGKAADLSEDDLADLFRMAYRAAK